jgi:hypothetical protein|tara:strand:+ start:98 stop:229 length:132 start_codon:yes stop_codon:yes gene_type:complete
VASFAKKRLLPKKGILIIAAFEREMGNENSGDTFTVTATDECE